MLETIAAKEGATAAEECSVRDASEDRLPTRSRAIFTSPQVASVDSLRSKHIQLRVRFAEPFPMSKVPKAIVIRDTRV